MIELSVLNETGSAVSAANPTVIKIIGCGGGGSSAVNRMIDSGVENVEFIVLNTDLQALNVSNAQKRLAIGQKLTGGLGAGGNPQVGEDAAKEDIELITNVVNGANMVIITAGMGGGTGTGSAPIVAEIAKNAGALTIAVVTTPFEFEGPVRMKFAMDGIEKLRKNVDSLIVIPNQKVMKIAGNDKKINFLQAFRIADDVLCQGVQGISDIITKPGIVNLDFADVKSVMRNQGEAILGVGRGRGENRVQDAVQQAINNPMLENRTIEGAKNILVNITSDENFSMQDVDEIVNMVKDSASKAPQVFWGQVLDSDMGDEIAITVIATGFETVEETPVYDEKTEQKEDSNIMSLESFQGVLRGQTSSAEQTSFNPANQGHSNSGMLFNDLDKPNAPQPNSFASEDINRSIPPVSSLGKGLNDAYKTNGSILPPEGFVCDKSNLQQPAVWRNLDNLSRSINLTDDK